MLYEGLAIDRYDVEELLGQGGMAEVWAARHRVLGTRRALKVLTQSQMSASLVEEGRLQAGLDHENVLPVLDVLEHAGMPVLVMPLVAGPTLRTLIAEHRLTPEQVVPLFRGVLEGVAAAHRHGIVHCDLKPSNVLLHRRGERVVPKVADFGIAVRLGVSRSGISGTREYASPEQLKGADPSPAADYYSLGVILHELLTGKRPTGAPTAGPLGDLVDGLLQADLEARTSSDSAVRVALDASGITPRPLPASQFSTPPRADAPTEATAPGLHRSSERAALPQLRDPFVGRRVERATLTQWLDGPGLVTITGPGGVGKTRLAIMVAGTLDHPVQFVDLTECRTAGDIVREVASAIGVPLDTRAPGARLTSALAGRGRLTLMLDNFEQVAAHAPETVGAWLAACPTLTVLVTSREILRLRGEQALPLPPLGLPGEGHDEAMELFEDRARRHDPSFTLDERTRPVVAHLVTLLDGLPLAIELAASRCRSLSPEGLVERIGDRFRLLVSRERGAVAPRHRTLEATLDWSWELLGPAEQQALAQLSVFEAGFTLQAAEAVVLVPGEWVEDLLAELVDKSLVRTWRLDEGEARMGLLVSVQAYASARLDERDERDEVELRHARWYAGDADEEGFMVHGGFERRRAGERELDNLRAALRRTMSSGAHELAVQAALLILALARSRAEKAPLLEPLEQLAEGSLLAALLYGRVLASEERTAEALEVLHQVADEAPATSPLRMKALRHIAHVQHDTAHPERALGPCDAALALARSHGARAWEADLVALRSSIRANAGIGGGEAELRDAIALAQEVGDRSQEAMLWNNLGVHYSRGPQHDVARRHYLRALALWEGVGTRRDRAWVLQNLAALAFQEGDPEAAAPQLEEAIRLFRLVGDRRTEGRRQKLLSRIWMSRGHLDRAHAALDEGESVLRSIGDDIGLALLHVGRAEVCHAQGRFEAAQAALESARAMIGHLDGTSAQDELVRVTATLSEPPDLDG